jgi:threonine dehydrogenase-like Zn-dependent dehydrogenase
MKAMVYHRAGTAGMPGRAAWEQVADPGVEDSQDVVVRVETTTVCGTDLHILSGDVPEVAPGTVLGHEAVGEVVEVGPEAANVRVGDRVLVCCCIACGRCWYCKNQEFAMCDNSNPNAALAEKITTYAGAGVFGFSHLYGGYAGCQAGAVRVPYADVNLFRVPEGMSDEQALACTDVFPTGFMAADFCDIRGGDTVAVWGCGPVGQFAIKSAYLLGAERVIAIDNVPERLHMAADKGGASVLNGDQVNVTEALRAMTGGRGPDACIDAVGMEAHGTNFLENVYDRVKTALMLQSDRMAVMRQMISACRKGGTLSVIGVYSGLGDKVPLGVAFGKNLKFRMGQQHGQRYMPRLFEYCQRGAIDPSFVFTHRMALDEAPRGYEMFRNKEDGCIKVALRP